MAQEDKDLPEGFDPEFALSFSPEELEAIKAKQEAKGQGLSPEKLAEVEALKAELDSEREQAKKSERWLWLTLFSATFLLLGLGYIFYGPEADPETNVVAYSLGERPENALVFKRLASPQEIPSKEEAAALDAELGTDAISKGYAKVLNETPSAKFVYLQIPKKDYCQVPKSFTVSSNPPAVQAFGPETTDNTCGTLMAVALIFPVG